MNSFNQVDFLLSLKDRSHRERLSVSMAYEKKSNSQISNYLF